MCLFIGLRCFVLFTSPIVYYLLWAVAVLFEAFNCKESLFRFVWDGYTRDCNDGAGKGWHIVEGAGGGHHVLCISLVLLS